MTRGLIGIGVTLTVSDLHFFFNALVYFPNWACKYVTLPLPLRRISYDVRDKMCFPRGYKTSYIWHPAWNTTFSCILICSKFLKASVSIVPAKALFETKEIHKQRWMPAFNKTNSKHIRRYNMNAFYIFRQDKLVCTFLAYITTFNEATNGQTDIT